MRVKAVLLAAGLLMAMALSACAGPGDSPNNNTGSGTPTVKNMQIAVTTDPNPPKPGPVTITVEVMDKQGSPVDDAKVLLYAGMPSMGHGGIEGELEALGSGKYQGKGTFSMGGAGRIDVEVNKEGIPAEKQSFDIRVAR